MFVTYPEHFPTGNKRDTFNCLTVSLLRHCANLQNTHGCFLHYLNSLKLLSKVPAVSKLQILNIMVGTIIILETISQYTLHPFTCLVVNIAVGEHGVEVLYAFTCTTVKIVLQTLFDSTHVHGLFDNFMVILQKRERVYFFFSSYRNMNKIHQMTMSLYLTYR